MMDKKGKKRIKAELKALKKSSKVNQTKETVVRVESPKPSTIVRFADSVKGVIYLIFGISLIAAIFLGEQGVIITIDDIIGSLFLAVLGKVVLCVLAIALFIYGLKQLRVVK